MVPMDSVRSDTYRGGTVRETASRCRRLLRERDDNFEKGEKGDDERRDLVESFLERIGCRLYAFPSGSSLPSNLRTPPGGMVYGNLLLGGVTRFRLLGSASSNRPRRRAGERTLICSNNPQDEVISGWFQYGGPERNCDTLDIGSRLLLEITLLLTGFTVPLLSDDPSGHGEAILTSFPSSPEDFLVRGKTKEEIAEAQQQEGDTDEISDDIQVFNLESFSGRPTAKIVRSVLDGRVLKYDPSPSWQHNVTAIQLFL
jgi:hypothetical protein